MRHPSRAFFLAGTGYYLLNAFWNPSSTLDILSNDKASSRASNHSLVPFYALDGLTNVLWPVFPNITSTLALGLQSQERREQVIPSQMFSSRPIPMAFKIAMGPRQFVAMRPRGTRTIPPRHCDGKRVFYGASPVLSYMPPTVDMSASLGCWWTVLVVAALCLVYLFCSVGGLCCAFENLADVWLGISSDVERVGLCVFEWLIFALVDVFFWAHWFMESLLEWLSSCSEAPIRFARRVIEEQRTKEWEHRRLECIRRKLPIRHTGTTTIRPTRSPPRFSNTPLFSRKVRDNLECIYLPEESAGFDGYPERGMYDPRYFNLVQRIGAGAFGCILQVEHRITGKMMAMKKLVREDNADDDVDGEIRAMVRVQQKEWYPRLLGTFRDEESYYILMPFYPRGDLFAVVSSYGGCFHRTLAKFYLAELLLAIQGLHHMGIIHRDLKPENILFNNDGHLIVADFGIAHVFEDDGDEFMQDEYPLWEEKKQWGGDEFPLLAPSIDNPHTVSGAYGTPYYAAPEVLQGLPYSYGVDYYSVAISYHEMITGYVPLLIGAVKPGMAEPEIELNFGRRDIHLQTTSVIELDFLEKMLDPDPYSRPSVKQMKEHPVFMGIDWDKMSRRDVPIPHSPVLRKRVALSHSIIQHPTERYLSDEL